MVSKRAWFRRQVNYRKRKGLRSRPEDRAAALTRVGMPRSDRLTVVARGCEWSVVNQAMAAGALALSASKPQHLLEPRVYSERIDIGVETCPGILVAPHVLRTTTAPTRPKVTND